MIIYKSCRVWEMTKGQATSFPGKNTFFYKQWREKFLPKKWKKLLTNEFESDIVNKLSLRTKSAKTEKSCEATLAALQSKDAGTLITEQWNNLERFWISSCQNQTCLVDRRTASNQKWEEAT